MQIIDLRSDTVTVPTPDMREAMAHADVGDDVYGEDPTVQRLEAVAAERVGKEAALFVPSGTMANQLAIKTHTCPGDALIAGQGAHIELFEGGGAAALSGVQTGLIGDDGFFTADDVKKAIHPDDAHYARTRLVCIENTHNQSGGRVFPQELIDGIAKVARSAGLALHLDGARLFNAAVATGMSAAELANPFDSVAFCLSKGLGAPVGSLLCGDRAVIRMAHRHRKMIGGGMRQAGILAAGGLHALDHHVARLAEDHENARRLARAIDDMAGLALVAQPETNIVLFDVADVRGTIARLTELGVKVGTIGPGRIRAVTHQGITHSDVDVAIERLRQLEASTAVR
jgi:threonine aldolase